MTGPVIGIYVGGAFLTLLMVALSGKNLSPPEEFAVSLLWPLTVLYFIIKGMRGVARRAVKGWKS